DFVECLPAVGTPLPAKLAGFRHISLAAHHISTCTRPSRARMKTPGRRVRDVPGRRRTVACEARREDCTPVAWYRCVYAPRTGGAHDSHHRTPGIAGRTRRGGRVAVRGARAAAGVAGDRVPPPFIARSRREPPPRIPPGPERGGFRRKRKCCHRIWSNGSAAHVGVRPGPPSGRRHRITGWHGRGTRCQSRDHDDTYRLSCR